jgi:hypothetical protein
MTPEMVAQMTMGRECPSAALETTDEWFLSVMNSHVGFKIAFLGEFLAAFRYRTLKGLLTTLKRIKR